MGGRNAGARRKDPKASNPKRSSSVPPKSPQRDPDASTVVVNDDLGLAGNAAAIAAAAAAATPVTETTTNTVDLTATDKPGTNNAMFAQFNADILHDMQNQFQVLLDSGRAGELNQDQPPAATSIKEALPPHLTALV